MNTSRRLAAAAVTLLAALGAQAETYEGVAPSVSLRSRAEVNAEAVRAASAADQNVVRGSRGVEVFTPTARRDGVRAQAELAAAAPDQNVVAGSRVNSRVVSTLRHPAEVRAERAAAAGAGARAALN